MGQVGGGMTAEWMDRAQCLGVDMTPDAATAADVAELAEHCHGCPVLLQCRQVRVSQGQGAYGMWAGTWCGDKPRRPLSVHCDWCGVELVGERSSGRYCGGGCRVAAYRARRAAAVVA